MTKIEKLQQEVESAKAAIKAARTDYQMIKAMNRSVLAQQSLSRAIMRDAGIF